MLCWKQRQREGAYSDWWGCLAAFGTQSCSFVWKVPAFQTDTRAPCQLLLFWSLSFFSFLPFCPSPPPIPLFLLLPLRVSLHTTTTVVVGAFSQQMSCTTVQPRSFFFPRDVGIMIEMAITRLALFLFFNHFDLFNSTNFNTSKCC